MADLAIDLDYHLSGMKVYPDRLQQITAAVLGLDRWFDSMRQPGGYGGPAVHWWWDSAYSGVGLDWRYEGIILGYLNLWQASGDQNWLDKARRAGDDLAAGQLPSGNYRNSQFELNPGAGGTPHEAACDLALISLASALKAAGDPDWEIYQETARRNLVEFYIARLWDPDGGYFRDDPSVPSFVPNKAATLVEALFAYSNLCAEDQWITRYALPTLEVILAHQVSGGELDGAIYQNSFGARKVSRFFPFYIARCIPALLLGYDWTGGERFARAALAAAQFILRWRDPDGSFVQVIYPGARYNRYPQWIAAVGDTLRCLDLATAVGLEYDPAPSQEWLLSGVKPDGGLCTASGFGKVTPFGKEDDPRDEISVCGWADKAFRYWSKCLVSHSTDRAF